MRLSWERVKLLNRYAGSLFGVVQQSLRDEAILSIFRLTDPAVQGGKDNLCLNRLVDTVKPTNSKLGAALAAQSAVIDALLNPFSDLRNKCIAHNDLTTAQASYSPSSGVPGAGFPSRAIINQVLGEIRGFMHDAESAYSGDKTMFEDPNIGPVDGDDLIRHLKKLDDLRNPRA